MKQRLPILLLLAACDDTTSNTPPPSIPATHDLVFEGYDITTPQLWTRNGDTGEVNRLLPPDSVVMDPEPSPDGTRIAFVVADYIQGIGDIFVMDHDGSNVKQLAFDLEMDDQPSWPPDGTRIVFRSWQGGYLGDIWVMDGDGGNQMRLT